jgi:hypothetical protein
MPATKLVHIDLKGAPLKPCAFWEDFCRLVSKWGASGLLVEWEDSVRFPSLSPDPPPDFFYDRDQVLVLQNSSWNGRPTSTNVCIILDTMGLGLTNKEFKVYLHEQ